MVLYLGEKSYVYAEVSAATGVTFTISSVKYTIYKCSDDSVVDSGVGGVSDHLVYALWEPSETGLFVVDFDYVVGSETRTSRQVVEVTKTI